jgi:hypothetical protein
MTSTTTNAPATVKELGDLAERQGGTAAALLDTFTAENFPALRKGPAAGDVETTWTPEEGFLVYVGDSEGMTVEEARKLAADLRGVLERVEGL